MGCFIPSCPNRRKKKGDHMFKAPSKVGDLWKEILRKVVRGVEFELNNKEHRLCSDHFEEGCIEKVNSYLIQGERIEWPKRWILKPDSLPTIFNSLPPSSRPRVVRPRKEIIRRKLVKPPVPPWLQKVKTQSHAEVTTYEARRVPPSPPPPPRKYTVETNGKCFMCLEELIGGANGDEVKVKPVTITKRRSWKGKKRKLCTSKPKYPVCSLKMLTSYLKMDLRRIFGAAPALPNVEEVEVSLCGECASKSSAVTGLLNELEEIQNRLKGSLREISGLMKGGIEEGHQEEGQWQQLPSASTRRDLSTTDIEEDDISSDPEVDLANKFRNELIFKCSRPHVKKNSLLTHVQLRPTPMPNDIPPTLAPPTTAATSPDSDPSGPNGQQEEMKQQEILFMYQEEGEDAISADIGRFDEEELFPGSNPAVEPDIMMETDDSFPATPASPELIVFGEDELVEPITSEQLSNSDAVTNDSSKGSDSDRPQFTKKTPNKLPGPEAPIGRQLKCPYCPKTFILHCNVKTHILNKHRFKVFRQHLPPGTGKKLVLTEVKNILRQYKVLDKGKMIGCQYCPRKFTPKDLELLVVQNHALAIHFNEIVAQLRTRIAKQTGGVINKVGTKDDDNDIVEIPADLNDRVIPGKRSPRSHIPLQSMTPKNVAGVKSKMKTGKLQGAVADKPAMVIDVPSDSEDVTPQQTLHVGPVRSKSMATDDVRIVKENDTMVFDISSDSESDNATADVTVPPISPIPRLGLVQFPTVNEPLSKTNDDGLSSVNILPDKHT